MMTQWRDIVLPVLIGSTALLLFVAQAKAEGHEGRRRGPPQVAIDACGGVEVGGSCSFEGRRGRDLSGECREIRDTLACVPEGHDRRRRQRDDS